MQSQPRARRTHRVAILALALALATTTTTAPPSLAQPAALAPHNLASSTPTTTIVLNHPVSILGVFGTGHTLRVSEWLDPEISATYQWQLDNVDVPQATTDEFTTTTDHTDKTLSVEITLTKPNHTPHTFEVTAPGPIRDIALNPQGSNEPYCRDIKPSDSTTPLVGWNLYYYCQDLNTNQGTTGTRNFKFFRNHQEVQNSTSSTYPLAPEDAGQTITAVYLRTWTSGLQWQMQNTFADEIQPRVNLDNPEVVGTQTLGSTLTASATSTDSVTYSYQWYRDFWPIAEATSATYQVTAEDLNTRIQVLVTATATAQNKTPTSRISDPLTPDSTEYAKNTLQYIADLVPAEPVATDIDYVKSTNYPTAQYELNQSLLDRAAAFWSEDFQPTTAFALYFSPDDVAWADAYLDDRFPTVSISLAQQMQSYGCPFATASYWASIDTYFFVQCGTAEDSDNLIYRHITPHEYTHWVQYSSNANLYMASTPWLVEGQGNFYGLALAELGEEPDMDMINWHLAHQAFNFDNTVKVPQGTHVLLERLSDGNAVDVELLLTRNGSVHEKYLLGHLMSEYLVQKFGHDLYWQWSTERFKNKSDTYATDLEVVRGLTQSILGINWDDLYISAIPYLAMRATEIREHYLAETAPKLPPNPPSLTAASSQPAAALLTWNSNGDNGSEILDFKISWNGGSKTCGTSPCLVTGLNNGQEYEFTVQARNAYGYSNSSNAVRATPAGTPSAPPNLEAFPGDSQVVLRWNPANANGSAVIEYRVEWEGGSKWCPTTSCTITGLTNGRSYTFTVTARNAVGLSNPTSSSAVIPAAKPSPPIRVSITSTKSLTQITLIGSKSNGSAISKIEYVIKLKTQKAFSTWKSVGTKTTIAIKKLKAKSNYQIKFRISNARGSTLSKVFTFKTS